MINMENKIPEHITWKVLKSGTVLLNLNNGAYYTLNRTGSDIWDNIVAKKEQKEIVGALREVYDCSPEQAETDVNNVLSFLEKEGLLGGGNHINDGINEKKEAKHEEGARG